MAMLQDLPPPANRGPCPQRAKTISKLQQVEFTLRDVAMPSAGLKCPSAPCSLGVGRHMRLPWEATDTLPADTDSLPAPAHSACRLHLHLPPCSLERRRACGLPWEVCEPDC